VVDLEDSEDMKVLRQYRENNLLENIMTDYPLDESYLFDEIKEKQERLRPLELLKLMPRILILRSTREMYRFFFCDQAFADQPNGYGIELVIRDEPFYRLHL
jgi:hypothetical protein